MGIGSVLKTKSARESASGPPRAPAALSSPAARSKTWAVKSPVSYWTIRSRVARSSGVGPWACPLGRAVRLVGEVEVDGDGRALLEGLAAGAEWGRRSTVAGSIVGKISAFERGR